LSGQLDEFEELESKVWENNRKKNSGEGKWKEMAWDCAHK
jgi:hypothetical protein